MRTLMLKLATAALLLLMPIAGAFIPPHAGTTPATASVVANASAATSPSHADQPVVSPAAVNSADQAVGGVAFIVATPADLITAGVCAALLGCCILGLALVRLYRRGAPRPSWVATVRRNSAVAFLPAPLAWPIRPSLVVLSISRT